MTEQRSHWTAAGSIRIVSKQTPSGETLYVPSVKFKDANGRDVVTELPEYLSAGRAAQAVLSGEHDREGFRPSELDVPGQFSDWNGHW